MLLIDLNKILLIYLYFFLKCKIKIEANKIF